MSTIKSALSSLLKDNVVDFKKDITNILNQKVYDKIQDMKETLEPKAEGEKEFVRQHGSPKVHDYPGATKDQFKSNKKRSGTPNDADKSPHDNEDEDRKSVLAKLKKQSLSGKVGS